MLTNLYAHPIILLYGALTGIALGFLIQKGRLSQYKVIVGQLLLKDFTMIKVMFTAIIVGGVGIFAIRSMGIPAPMHLKSGSILSVTLGASIMGIGMAILGYCPGTCVAAAGQGSGDAKWGLLGMFFGAFLYAELDQYIAPTLLSIGKIKYPSFPKLFGVSPWIILFVLIVIGGSFLIQLEKKNPSV